MKPFRPMKLAALLLVLLLGASTHLVSAQPSYSFKVHNKTSRTIVSLLASETGDDVGEFDIGNGISPGKSATLVWDKSTDESNCEWAFTAVYDDGSYSEPVMIDFCEDDLELVFEE